MKEVKNANESVCPECGSYRIDFGNDTPNLANMKIYFNVECKDCGIHFREEYSLEFTGQRIYEEKK